MGALYRHWTAAFRVPLIVAAGLRPTESNVSMTQPHAGPDVVWLLPPDADPGDGISHGLHAAKRTGWVDVDVPAIRWLDWQWTAAMDPEWRDTIITAGGGLERAEQWYVWPNTIRPARMVRWHPNDF